jgi:hypothetical protein
MACVNDPFLPSPPGCEYVCTQTSDCPDPSTTCQSGSCRQVPCGSGHNGNVGEACTAADAGDGTCYGAVDGNDAAGLCIRNGTSAGPCLWPSPSSPPSLTCPADQTCATFYDTTGYFPLSTAFSVDSAGNVPPGAYLGTCVPICSVTVPCPHGQSCNLSNLGGTEFAQGCAQDSDGGCRPGAGHIEFGLCGSEVDCSCPLSCQADPLYAPEQVCEGTCVVDSDCPNAGDACQGGFCTHRLCGLLPDGGMASGSTQNGPCTVYTANDGTCVPSFNTNQLGAFGICYLGGTAMTDCDPRLPYDAGVLCQTGSFCVDGMCRTVCDPNGSACADGGLCIQINDNHASGVCVGP